jgi:excisionase family DNA binding protein
MPDANNGDLLRIEEAAALLRIRPSTVRSWVLRRKIPYVKIGRLVRLRRSDCDALIVASLVPACPTASREAAL